MTEDVPLVGVVLLLGVVIVLFVRDVWLIWRREPIRYWFSDTVRYPDDPFYWVDVFQRMAPYLVVISLAVFIAVVAI